MGILSRHGATAAVPFTARRIWRGKDVENRTIRELMNVIELSGSRVVASRVSVTLKAYIVSF